MGVAFAAAAAHYNQYFFIRGYEIGDDFLGLGIAHDGAAGEQDDQVLAAFAALMGAFAVHAGFGQEFFAVFKIEQGAVTAGCGHIDIAAFAPVPAVGAASRHI